MSILSDLQKQVTQQQSTAGLSKLQQLQKELASNNGGNMNKQDYLNLLKETLILFKLGTAALFIFTAFHL